MIEVNKVSKLYGARDALSELSFSLERGDVCGLIGPNGSGKTTLLRILSTLIAPTFGTAKVAGFDVRTEGADVRRNIGYMPDTFGGDQALSVDAYLEFFARIWRIPPAESLRRIEDILRLVDLVHLRNTPIERISHGSRQRLSIGRVLLHNPDVILLDEPISGLDPRARVEMRGLLRELGRLGKTILISSHILADLADLCGTLLVLDEGELVFSGSLGELKLKVQPERWIEVAVEGDPAPAREFLLRQPWANSVGATQAGHLVISLNDGVSAARISAALMEAGFQLSRLLEGEVDLEEAFIRITRAKRT